MTERIIPRFSCDDDEFLYLTFIDEKQDIFVKALRMIANTLFNVDDFLCDSEECNKQRKEDRVLLEVRDLSDEQLRIAYDLTKEMLRQGHIEFLKHRDYATQYADS